jgi:hypothetical protein
MLSWEYQCICGESIRDDVENTFDVLNRPVCPDCGALQSCPRLVIQIAR